MREPVVRSRRKQEQVVRRIHGLCQRLPPRARVAFGARILLDNVRMPKGQLGRLLLALAGHQPTNAAPLAARGKRHSARPKLSPRRRETLDLLLRGWSEMQIARRMRISPHTVHVNVKVVYQALGVHSRGELMAFWMARSLTSQRS